MLFGTKLCSIIGATGETFEPKSQLINKGNHILFQSWSRISRKYSLKLVKSQREIRVQLCQDSLDPNDLSCAFHSDQFLE